MKYITTVDGVSENILLTQDSDYTSELEYTVQSSSGLAITSVEFLAGNESSFKLGIEGISAIDYNTDFDMTLVYDITDVDGDSDSGSVTISLDGDESIIYDSTKTSIDAGSDATVNGGLDTLVFATTGENIDFSTISDDKIKNFEIIDLNSDADGSNGVHSLLNLSLADVAGLTDSNNELKIFGDSSDSVTSIDTDGISGTGEWTQASDSTETIDGISHTFEVFSGTHSGEIITLKIDTAVNDSII